MKPMFYIYILFLHISLTLNIENKVIYVIFGLSLISSWEEVNMGLKEKFGGTRCSIPRTVLRYLQVSSKPSDTLGEFAMALGEIFQALRSRVADSYVDQREVQARMKIYEELVAEVMQLNMPEKTRGVIKLIKPKSVEENVKVLVDEEAEGMEEREDR